MTPHHSRWFELRPRSPGMLGFMLHRSSGVALVGYLYLHLAVLSQLRDGPQAWDAFIAQVSSPLFLALDGLLLFGLVFHGVNGLRVTLVGFGRGLRFQKGLFWACLVAAIILAVMGLLKG